MIKRLKTKFVILAMVSLFVLLTIVVTGMNILNYNSVAAQADEILSILSRNKGDFPEPGGPRGDRLPPDMSPELPYESRYFSVLMTGDAELIEINTTRIAAIDSEEAAEYGRRVLSQDKHKGFTEHFRYLLYKEGETVRITFLDCSKSLNSFYTFLLTSCLMALVGLIIVFFAMLFFAQRLIRPIAESYEKQKRFITDAGHEIKTPLTIINANVDLLEMEIGENECLYDISQQTKRLTSLTNDLVYLARMEESENPLGTIEFPVSDVVLEAAGAFKAIAQTQNKEFICDVQPMLSMKGNEKSIAQLVSLLTDNALKYSPEGGRVKIKLTKQGKNLVLTVFNATAEPVKEKELNRLFDRFYRTDPSRNSETGGHGIGLSVAKAIVNAHNGKLQAGTKGENTFIITATLPT